MSQPEVKVSFLDSLSLLLGAIETFDLTGSSGKKVGVEKRMEIEHEVSRLIIESKEEVELIKYLKNDICRNYSIKCNGEELKLSKLIDDGKEREAEAMKLIQKFQDLLNEKISDPQMKLLALRFVSQLGAEPALQLMSLKRLDDKDNSFPTNVNINQLIKIHDQNVIIIGNICGEFMEGDCVRKKFIQEYEIDLGAKIFKSSLWYPSEKTEVRKETGFFGPEVTGPQLGDGGISNEAL